MIAASQKPPSRASELLLLTSVADSLVGTPTCLTPNPKVDCAGRCWAHQKARQTITAFALVATSTQANSGHHRQCPGRQRRQISGFCVASASEGPSPAKCSSPTAGWPQTKRHLARRCASGPPQCGMGHKPQKQRSAWNPVQCDPTVFVPTLSNGPILHFALIAVAVHGPAGAIAFAGDGHCPPPTCGAIVSWPRLVVTTPSSTLRAPQSVESQHSQLHWSQSTDCEAWKHPGHQRRPQQNRRALLCLPHHKALHRRRYPHPTSQCRQMGQTGAPGAQAPGQASAD
mmetsp:Transcript_16255/g.35844  ORF Transcript_16255/g.35844 Transcript_16255/m.35844 type:complete len:286 (-) Transcript_16255:164-1021(-)